MAILLHHPPKCWDYGNVASGYNMLLLFCLETMFLWGPSWPPTHGPVSASLLRATFSTEIVICELNFNLACPALYPKAVAVQMITNRYLLAIHLWATSPCQFSLKGKRAQKVWRMNVKALSKLAKTGGVVLVFLMMRFQAIPHCAALCQSPGGIAKTRCYHALYLRSLPRLTNISRNIASIISPK